MSRQSKGRAFRDPEPAAAPPASGIARVATHPAFVCLLLAAATLAVYWPVVHFDFVNVDDDIYVTDNNQVLRGLTWNGVKWAFTNLTAGFWHPLTWLSHMADVQLYGLQAGGHHLTAVLLHVAGTCLLFLLLRRMTRATWRSAMVAGLFALHPLHVEAVAWVAERKEVLSAFFGFLTLFFYVRYAQPETAGRRSWIINYLLSLSFFICGLMSKPMVVTVPVMMLLLDCWPLRRLELGAWPPAPGLRVMGRLVLEKTPFFALALVSGLVTIHAESGLGALGSTEAYPLPVRAANAAVSYVQYLRQLFWPAGLAFPYPYPGSMPLAVSLPAGVGVFGLCGLAVWLGRRRPYLAVGWFWYLLTLLPVIGLI